ncbi:MAG: hypothetical protein JWP49_822 [Phenylobacterium sp.]|nr:hypothetical protein [Phenylobacterium sp.]
MKILRIAVGVVVGLYGLFCLFPIGANAAWKLGLIHPADGHAARLVPLWAATSWPQLIVWAAVVALFPVVGWRLVRGRPAFRLYLTAFVLDAALWWFMQSAEAYQQVFTPAELQMDYDMLLGMAVAALAIWWVERRPGAEAASA